MNDRNSSASKSIDKRNNFSLNKNKSTTSLNKSLIKNKKEEFLEVVYPENEENDKPKRPNRGRKQNREENRKRGK